jgi:hypothetical protein
MAGEPGRMFDGAVRREWGEVDEVDEVVESVCAVLNVDG